MTYPALMVQLQLGRSHTGLLQITQSLAEQFGAGVIGIVACQPLQMIYGETYVSGDLLKASFDEFDEEIAVAETEFRAAFSSQIKILGWQKSITFGPLCDFVAQEGRSADLIITGVTPSGFLSEDHVMSITDLVMQAGRPVLIVPESKTSLNLNRVLVAWNDTREARRAITDALPMLKEAVDVTVVQLAAEEEVAAVRRQLDDVIEWLGRHGVKASAVVAPSSGDDADELSRYATAHGADLLVAGAYGHSRMREWALGGVTRDLLLGGNICSLVSH